MSEQTQTYYGREEEVETPEMQLDNFRAQEGAAKAVEVWAQETLVNIYDKTLEMWNAAAERGDAETQNGLTELYKGAEHMQQNLLHTNTAMKSVLEAAQALAKQKEAIEKDLNTLVEAVESGDSNDPRVEALMEQIETGVYEFIEYNAPEMLSWDEDEDEGKDKSEDIYDNAISDMLKVIRQSAPNTTYMIGERFFRTLLGDYQMNDIQRGLLISLVNTITLDDES